MSETIKVDIVEKRGNRWRIIGLCPTSVTPSGALHVYRGRNACVRDAETDQVIVKAKGFSLVLQALADLTGLAVELTDETKSLNVCGVFEPTVTEQRKQRKAEAQVTVKLNIEQGFWNCCQAKPTKIVAFDDDRDGAPTGALVWHYACAGCASTVHPSRVMDAPACGPEQACPSQWQHDAHSYWDESDRKRKHCGGFSGATGSACDCPDANVWHYRGCATLRAGFKDAKTADGHLITDGMAVWDYDLRPGRVNLGYLSDDGWFEVTGAGQTRGSMMNDVRVCVRHPFTNQLASEALRQAEERIMETDEFTSYLKAKADKEILRYAVSRTMFCQACQAILDVKTAVLFEVARVSDEGTQSVTTCATHLDQLVANAEGLKSEGRITGYEVYDGRELFGRKKKVAQ